MQRYLISEVFASVQGEGRFSGTPSTFVRFYGCNLSCPWCDEREDFKPRDVTQLEVVDVVRRVYDPRALNPVVLTGGEPTLQRIAPLSDSLRRLGYGVHLETNGTSELDFELDWVTVSPKVGSVVKLKCANEVKVVMDGVNDPAHWRRLIYADVYSVQACDGFPSAPSPLEVLEYATLNGWNFSARVHKLIGFR